MIEMDLAESYHFFVLGPTLVVATNY